MLMIAAAATGPEPVTRHGLTAVEAAVRLRRMGPNVLPVVAPPPAWRTLLGHMVHFFALMLWVAGALAFVAGMPQLGASIFLIVLINGVFAFAQEHRAERAADRLRTLLPYRVTVLRDGAPCDIDAHDLVVDDVVVLGAGDRVSADLRLIEAHTLALDTSTLTGESVAATPDVGEIVFAGTFVVEGEGLAVVTATGPATRLAGIARLTQAGLRPRSPLARELDRLVRIVASVAVGVGVAFFGVAILLGLPLGDGFLFAIGVAVALTPEGLLPTVTLSLALGAQRMAARRALVRRLESVETLGSTTFICTDKTGTLTCNDMAVVEVWTPVGRVALEPHGYDPTAMVLLDGERLPAVRMLALAAGRCSRGRTVLRDGRWVAQGDPMEAALDVLARRLAVDLAASERAEPVTRRLPFDPRRRRMSVAAGGQLLVKGAPDAILPRCRAVDRAHAALVEMTERGLRVLAIAVRRLDDVSTSADADTLERDLELLGLVGMEDAPRPGVAAAIASCRQAGIRLAMITGDHPSTARAIAREIGLLGPDGLVLEGHDLPSDDVTLGALLDRDGIVVSRVAPEDKLRIARALRARGHVVAMTGDGVNDGPALQEADIGVAMGRSGTDVAREAADLVLLDDDFATIVAAVEQGRATFANIRRFLTYHLTDNVAELAPFVIWALSAGRFPLALGVLQILCLDVGTDQLPALGLGTEPPAAGTLRQPPHGRHLIDGALLRRVFGVLGPAEAAMEMAAFVAVLAVAGWRPGESLPDASVLAAASGAAFAAVIFGQAANAFACRSTTQWPGALSWATNRLLLLGVTIELALLVGFLMVSPVAAVLGHAPPPWEGWLIALASAPAVLLVDAFHKHLRRWKVTRSGSPVMSGPGSIPRTARTG
ncbi:MAG: cation-transporting P-type ATPase [Chloroflexi bacterium]|nr:cation-transporting P-type ATPase [Chloroflexota bacterium]